MARRKRLKIGYLRARVMHAVVFMAGTDGTLKMTKEHLESILKKHDGGYISYAFILHDKDKYSAQSVYENQELNKKTYKERYQILADAKGLDRAEESELGFAFDDELSMRAQAYADEQFPKIEEGQKKPPHWHVVLNFANSRDIGEVARWFKLLDGTELEPNWIEIKTGRGAVENAWLYLVHQNDKTKYQYDKNEVFASFDYLEKLQDEIEKQERNQKFEIDPFEVKALIEQVANDGLKLDRVKEILGFGVYVDYKAKFEAARVEYVNSLPMPFERQVYYIESKGLDEGHGKGGVGKSAIAKGFAKQMAGRCGADVSLSFDELKDYIFVAGNKNVFVQNYDGQPVLFIDEINAIDLKVACNGVASVKTLLDPFPVNQDMNIKYGSKKITAQYIIINGIQTLEKFKEDLATSSHGEEAETDQMEQFDRRFWGSIRVIDARNVEYWVNRGLFDDMPDLQNQLAFVAMVRTNIQKIASETTGFARARLEEKTLRPLLDEITLRSERKKESGKISEIEDLDDSFDDIGVIVQDEFEEFREYTDEDGNIYTQEDFEYIIEKHIDECEKLSNNMCEDCLPFDDGEPFENRAEIVFEKNKKRKC